MSHILSREDVQRITNRALVAQPVPPIPEDSLTKDALKEIQGIAKKMIPQSMRMRARRAFTPRGVGFLDFYELLRRINLGEPTPGDLYAQYRKAVKLLARITSPVDNLPVSPLVLNQLAESQGSFRLWLGWIDKGTQTPRTWKLINESLVPLIVSMLKDKGIYVRANQRGRERWPIFRKMNPKQEKLEKLQDYDPEGYALMLQKGETLEQIDQGIQRRIARSRMGHKKVFFMGRPVNVGIDPVTGEERFYTRDGQVLTRDEYIAHREEQAEEQKKLSRLPDRTVVDPSEMYRLTEEQMDDLEGDVEWAALTDDKAKQGRLTKILPTKRYPVFISDPETGLRVEKVQVITEGRYKGMFLDDMVNSQGRLIEGTAYELDGPRGRKVPVKADVGEREPYVTVADVKVTRTVNRKKVTTKERKLYLKLGAGNKWAPLRNAIKKLTCNAPNSELGTCISSISYHPEMESGNAVGFYFEPKDFAVIKDALQGLSLSKGAMEELRSYFKELARAEIATVKENLGNYSMEALGGFKESRVDPETGERRPVDLLTKQKQALAWLDANGNRGVCALETGMGKTLTSLAMMQKLSRDGIADEDATYQSPDGRTVQTNGRFLFVCPKDLRGNLAKEIRNWLQNPDDLLKRVDVLSYRQFSGASKSGVVPRALRSIPFWRNRMPAEPGKKAAKYKAWDPAFYVAVFFDEAHNLSRNKNSARFKAANGFYHPRKIPLTASPMEKEPEQAYLLSSIANNIPMTGAAGRQNSRQMYRFLKRFTERVGGRVIGVKQDPVIKRDLDSWVKKNIFHADKTDVEEIVLPELRPQTMVLEMPDEVEEVYRKATREIADVMKGLVQKFRDRKINKATGNPDLEKIYGWKFAPLFNILNGLQNYPAETFRDIANIMRTGRVPGNREFPEILDFITALPFTPDELDQMANELGNPKLDQAQTIITDKLVAAEDTNMPPNRTLLFSDDKRLCMMTGKRLSKNIPGWHVVGLSNEIHILSGDRKVSAVTFEISREDALRLARNEATFKKFWSETGGRSRHETPFRKKKIRKHPGLPAHKRLNTHYKSDLWQQFVLQEIVKTHPKIRTATLLGMNYQFGHNLQTFNTVIHLDRNTWNSENMKQRTARAWRTGQDNPVEEITLDSTYAERPGRKREFDATLDEIRRYFQEVESEVFDHIIKDAQRIALGGEWEDIKFKDASLFRLDRQVMDLMTSPYVENSKVPGDGS